MLQFINISYVNNNDDNNDNDDDHNDDNNNFASLRCPSAAPPPRGYLTGPQEHMFQIRNETRLAQNDLDYINTIQLTLS